MKKCPLCKGAGIIQERVDLPTRTSKGKKRIARQVPRWRCERCGEVLYDHSGMAVLETARFGRPRSNP